MPDFKALTRTKKLKTGTYIGEFATSGVARLLKSASCEFAFVDMEHSGFSFETAKALLRNLHDVDIATLLRPPSQAHHHLARACDIGAQGIIPPMVGTAAQARACIDAIKYPPLGQRGCAFAIAHDDYHPAPVMDVIAAANEKITFMPLIETSEGIENVEEIASLEGVDGLWIGHFDLSASLGIPAQFDHPKFTDAVARVMAAAAKHSKNVGRLIGAANDAGPLFRQGCDFICYSGDIWIFQKALSEGVATVRSTIGKEAIAGEK
jgi:2-keto-3-deoxy-L-rhamnonate aldolase RhmA